MELHLSGMYRKRQASGSLDNAPTSAEQAPATQSTTRLEREPDAQRVTPHLSGAQLFTDASFAWPLWGHTWPPWAVTLGRVHTRRRV